MKLTQAERDLVERRSREGKYNWNFPACIGGDIYDLELKHYTKFLDNVSDRNTLVEGLRGLSPIADDALAVAEAMDDADFLEFKLALPYERKQKGGKMPPRYAPLILPKWILLAGQVADRFNAPLGPTFLRIVDLEE